MSKENKKNKFNTFLSSIIILSFLMINFPMVPISKASVESTLYFSEAGLPDVEVTDKTVKVGDDFTLVATINPNANQVAAAELHVNFDPSKFSLTSITAPSAPSDCSEAPAFSVVLQSAAIDNTAGTGSIILGVCMSSPPSPIINISPIATFVFHALAATSGPLPVSLTGSMATGINESDNIVYSMTDANIKVDSLDVTAPVITNGTPSGTLAAGTIQTTVGVSTNEDATCKYNTVSGVAFDSMTNSFTTTGGKVHSFLTDGLSNGGSYGYFVRCTDANGNSNQSDYLVSFTVASPAVVVPKSSSSSLSHHKKDKKKKTPKRYVSNSKKKIARGKLLIQRGKKFSKNNYVLLYFSKFGGGYYAPQKIRTSSTGAFSLSYLVNKPMGIYSWYAVDVSTGLKSKTVSYKVK